MASTEELVVLEVADQRVAFRALDVREILRAVATVPFGGASPLWEGVIDLRGTRVPVLSLRVRFGLPAATIEPSHCFLIAETSGRLVALHADRARGLCTVDRTSPEGRPHATPWIAGVTQDAEGLLVVYDLRAFLTPDETTALDACLSRSAHAVVSP